MFETDLLVVSLVNNLGKNMSVIYAFGNKTALLTKMNERFSTLKNGVLPN